MTAAKENAMLPAFFLFAFRMINHFSLLTQLLWIQLMICTRIILTYRVSSSSSHHDPIIWWLVIQLDSYLTLKSAKLLFVAAKDEFLLRESIFLLEIMSLGHS